MTAPNGPSQQECVRGSMREAGLTANQITCSELHGASTPPKGREGCFFNDGLCLVFGRMSIIYIYMYNMCNIRTTSEMV